MATPTVTEEAAFEVARVEAEGGPQGAGLAFDQLECGIEHPLIGELASLRLCAAPALRAL